MKRLATLILIAALLACTMSALAEQPSLETAARSVVPENAELLRTDKDDGLMEYLFVTPDDMRYQVDVDPADGRVVHLEVEAVEKRGGSAALLNDEQAGETLLKLCPDATIYYVSTDRDDGRYVIQIRFGTDEFIGKAELNAETGALVEMELDYLSAPSAEKPLTKEEAKELVLSMVENGRIVDFETDRDDGRMQYEGELIADGVEYEFTIDADTGALIEWEKDH